MDLSTLFEVSLLRIKKTLQRFTFQQEKRTKEKIITMTGYNDDMRDYDFEKSEFVKLVWLNDSEKQFSSILPFDKALKMREILEVKKLPVWIEKC